MCKADSNFISKTWLNSFNEADSTIAIVLQFKFAHSIFNLEWLLYYKLNCSGFRHTPSMYPISPASAGFRSPYPSSLPISGSSLPRLVIFNYLIREIIQTQIAQHFVAISHRVNNAKFGSSHCKIAANLCQIAKCPHSTVVHKSKKFAKSQNLIL